MHTRVIIQAGKYIEQVWGFNMDLTGRTCEVINGVGTQVVVEKTVNQINMCLDFKKPEQYNNIQIHMKVA